MNAGGRPVAVEVHMERWRAMLRWQKINYPAHPSLRDLEELWGVSSISTVRNTLSFLNDKGLLYPQSKVGTKGSPHRQYYARKER